MSFPVRIDRPLSHGLPVVWLENTGNLQGKDISGMLDDPAVKVRDAALSSGERQVAPHRKMGFARLRKKGGTLRHGEGPQQYDNLRQTQTRGYANCSKSKVESKLVEIGKNDLNLNKL